LSIKVVTIKEFGIIEQITEELERRGAKKGTNAKVQVIFSLE
jgi:hypothetical protein